MENTVSAPEDFQAAKAPHGLYRIGGFMSGDFIPNPHPLASDAEVNAFLDRVREERGEARMGWEAEFRLGHANKRVAELKKRGMLVDPLKSIDDQILDALARLNLAGKVVVSKGWRGGLTAFRNAIFRQV